MFYDKLKSYLITGMLACSPVISFAHEMTPTYPELRPSHVAGLYVTTMDMFNKRADVEYYEIGVFDEDFNPIPFVTSYSIINIKYLQKTTFDVYIRKTDRERAEYICSRSKIRKEDAVRTAINSRICSKIK
jgi:hypothetical protein